VLRLGTGAHSLGAKLDEPDRQVFDVSDLDIEVHPVLPLLLLRDTLEQQFWSRPTLGYEEDIVVH
jgi:hypothetical protein